MGEEGSEVVGEEEDDEEDVEGEEVYCMETKPQKRKLSSEVKEGEKVAKAKTSSSSSNFSSSSSSSSLTTSCVQLKRWKIKPQSEDEGVLVPEPKPKVVKGVTIVDYVIGKGKVPKEGSKVSINYEGYLSNGKLFDSSLKRSKPFQFRLGTSQVIKGLDFGMTDMRVGGSREIIIPSQLG
jgi:FKBP-type peptidyl-prolyl cis-trans isomerase